MIFALVALGVCVVEIISADSHKHAAVRCDHRLQAHGRILPRRSKAHARLLCTVGTQRQVTPTLRKHRHLHLRLDILAICSSLHLCPYVDLAIHSRPIIAHVQVVDMKLALNRHKEAAEVAELLLTDATFAEEVPSTRSSLCTAALPAAAFDSARSAVR